MQQRQVIRIESKRLARVQRSGIFQHLSAGVLLVEAGLNQLQAHPGEDVALAWFSLLSGVVLIVAVVVELRHLRQARRHPAAASAHAPSPGGINWMDVVAVPSLIAEAWHKHHRGAHHLPYVYVGLAAITLLRGVVLGRLVRGPRVEIDGQGLFVRTTIFSRRRVAWGDVVGLTRTSRGVDVMLARGGTQSFDLTDAVNRDEVERAIVSAWTSIEAARIPPAPAVSVIAADASPSPSISTGH